ncbi:MAG TPA: peptidylprolyl isomerase [Streptosporangiaceae bacterium]|nr:peptidylprolyl isomerase [Streptosporangiaceae bacterium]
MAGKQERQRKLARERYQRRLAREADRQARARKLTQVTAGGVVVLVIVAVVVVGVIALTRNSSATAIASPSASPAATTPPSTATATPTPSATPVGPAKEPATHCTYTAHPPSSKKISGLPPSTPDFKATYQATINTNRGAIVIDLLNSRATCTVNSFVFLAGQNFFSNTTCHRLTTSGIFVLQCGDPTGTGSGGPGYSFNDENLTDAIYPIGTVAMANSGPNTNGSQFFLVYKDTSLPPSYTPFGTIVSGLNIIQQVAKAGSDNSNGAGDGHPKEKVEIESVTIKKT